MCEREREGRDGQREVGNPNAARIARRKGSDAASHPLIPTCSVSRAAMALSSRILASSAVSAATSAAFFSSLISCALKVLRMNE